MKRSSNLPALGAATIGTGAALTAVVASACCVGPALAPIFLAILGANELVAVSGLRPYTPWLLLGSAAMLAFSFWQLYYVKTCGVQSAENRPRTGIRVARLLVWTAASIWLASTTYAIYGLIHG